MEEKEIKKSSSLENRIKESTLPKEIRRKIRQKLSYIEPLEQPGTIYNAEFHGSAQRLLKVHRITKYVKFCKCCSLPQETPGVVIPFNFFDKHSDFGLGIYLYFYYIKICLIISIIVIGLASISTIIFSQDYSSDLNNYCDIILKNETKSNSLDDTFLKDCTKFSSTKVSNQTESNIYSNIIQVDWLISMSAHNIKNYHDIFKFEAKEGKKTEIENITLDYSLLYFITGITILIVDYLFILYINLLDEIKNFEETTPKDYTVLIHGVPKPKDDNKIKEEVINILSDVSYYVYPLQVYQIIPCLRMAEIYNIANEKYMEETKIYHVYNFEKQKQLNNKYGFNKSENNLHYFQEIFCIKRKTPIQNIKNKIYELHNKLNDLLNDFNTNPNKYNGGTFFVIFSNMKMKDKFYDFFPHSYGEKFIWLIRYFFECIIFGFCVNEQRKKKIKLKLSVNVSQATEPFEVQWENMGHTRFEINCYKFISLICTIGLIIVSLGIIIGLNTLQHKISSKDFIGNTFVKYLLSLLISVVLAVSNIVGEIVLEKLSNMEKIEYKTSFYISFSIKLTVYTFIIIGILPLASNYINGDWGNNDLLVNNMLMIFITNIILPPLLFYLSPGLGIKIYKRIKVKLELTNVKLEKSTYTQGELNEIFENPIMNIPYKYCYITNVFLVSLFYLSIFPIGIIFGFFGLLITYISEFFYIGLYKRPEILNSKLCKIYVYNFKWVVFIFSLGNYIFIGWLSKNNPINWSLINLIVFFIICLIPYQSIKINTLGMSESDSKKDTYKQNSIFFSTDYEKLCPFTRKEGFLRFFRELLTKNIIAELKCYNIIKNLQNMNEMDSYLKTSRHMENFCATMQLNNLYMKNKNLQKEEDIKKELCKDKNIFLSNDSNFLEKIIIIKDYLYYFSTTAAGISNALIFLDEKDINQENDMINYNNYNPWKVDWILSKFFLKKRDNLINEILENIDYRGEISDDEDTIINYGEKNLNIFEMNNNDTINNINLNHDMNNELDKKDNDKEVIINNQITEPDEKRDNKENISSYRSENIQLKENNNNIHNIPKIFNYNEFPKISSNSSI